MHDLLTVFADAKSNAPASSKRKRATLSEIAGPPNQEKPMNKRRKKEKPKEKLDRIVLEKSMVTTTTTGALQQPLKAVTDTVLQSRKTVSVPGRAQQLNMIREDVPGTCSKLWQSTFHIA